MATTTIRIDVDSLTKGFARLIPLMDRNVREALEAGSRIIADEARRLVDGGLVNRRTGLLLQSIVEGPIRGNLATGMTVDITAGSERLVYARFLEDGTRGPYTIEAKKGSALRWAGSTGDFIFRKRVTHPGIRARGFMKQAAESQADVVADLVATALEVAVEEAFP